MVGREARRAGFNVMLGGGINFIRDPRNGRKFEYISEDPLQSAAIVGEMIAGTRARA